MFNLGANTGTAAAGSGGFNLQGSSNGFQLNTGTGAAGGAAGGLTTNRTGFGTMFNNNNNNNHQQQQMIMQQQQYNPGPTTNDDRKYDEHLKALQSLITSYTQKVPSSTMAIGTPSMNLNDACSFRSLIYTESTQSSGSLAKVSFPSRPLHTSSESWKISVNRLVEHDLTDQLHPEVCVGAETLANYTESINNKLIELKEMITVSQQIGYKKDELTRISKERMEKIRNKHEGLMLKLLDVMIKLHVVQNMETPLQSSERDLYTKISQLHAKTKVSSTMVHDLRAEIAATNQTNQSNNIQLLEQTDYNILKQSLLHQKNSLDKLYKLFRKDTRDIEIIRK